MDARSGLGAALLYRVSQGLIIAGLGKLCSTYILPRIQASPPVRLPEKGMEGGGDETERGVRAIETERQR